MATYQSYISFKNGKRLSIHQPTTAPVGSYLPCEANGVAGATSSVEFSVPQGEVWEVSDFVSANTAGEFEIIADGRNTNRYLPTDASRAASAANRPPISMTFVPGIRYKLRETVAGAA